MVEPEKRTERGMDEPRFSIYAEDLEEAANDPRAKPFLEEAYANFKRMEAEGRVIY